VKIRFLIVFAVIAVLGGWETSAHAARNFTMTAQTPAAPAQVAMGSTGTLTFQITNANTGGNVGERIYEVRFRMSAGRSTFSAATAAPVGWTRTAYSTTSVTFRANAWANAIVTGSSLSFPIVFNFRSTTVDTAEALRDIRARNTTTVGGPPFTNLGSDTDTNQGSWTLKSLSITSSQTTDLFGTPVTAIASGTGFRLVMTIRNNSTSTKMAIVSSPISPTTIKTGTVTQGLTSTVYSPNPLDLAPGASGTITFTYTTAPADNGTIQFSAFARNGANTATSSTALSNVLAVSRVTASIAVTPACLFSGTTATFTMTVINNTGVPVINVTPSILTPFVFNSAAIGAFVGPAEPPMNLASGASGTFTWTATVTGTVPASGAKPYFYVQGSATANGGLVVTPVATSTPNPKEVDEYVVSVVPASTNASSTNEELIWTVSNRGCSAVNSVSILIPAGWTYASDGYAKVNLVGSTVDTWNPGAPNPVLFTAPIAAERIPLDYTGEFSLAFSAMPVVTGVSNFTVTIIDAALPPNTRTSVTPVVVNAFDPVGPNATDTFVWQEEFR